MKKSAYTIVAFLLTGYLGWNYFTLPVTREWSQEEVALIKSLSLTRLPPLPIDPSNRVADDELAADLGHRLFFDARLSANGAISCASCHQPETLFTDALPLAQGIDIGTRNTPSLVGVAYSPWFYWDGRKDSLWAQALAPIEAPHEQNFSRTAVLNLVSNDDYYRKTYEAIFGTLPDLGELPPSATPSGSDNAQSAWRQLSVEQQLVISVVFTNVGKALAAYERTLLPGPGHFDAYADSLSENSSNTASVLNATETAGLRLFIGKAQCVNCHNGPLFSNHEFHNTGVLPAAGQLPSMGRYDGVRTVRADPFNCIGVFSDARAEECVELRFARDSNDLVAAHKTPSLRNVSETAPYMHSGQLATLRDVMIHYNDAPLSMLSHNEAKPLGLRTVELRQLEAFLSTLTAPLATAPRWLRAPTAP